MTDPTKERAADCSLTDKLVLAVLDQRPAGATGLQKLGLTVKAIFEGGAPTSFEAYHYGGFDDDVAESLAALRDEGFIELVNGKTYRLTPSGRQLVEAELSDSESTKLKTISAEILPRLNHLSDEEIVSVVYSLFPDLADKSVIRGRVQTGPKRIKDVGVVAVPH